MKCRIIIVSVILLAISMIQGIAVYAGTTTDVIISAMGYVCQAPGVLTLTYISDYQCQLSWIKGIDATNTMVRVKYGGYPIDRNDGHLVYYGIDNNVVDDTANTFRSELPYYRAWSQNAAGIWEEIGYKEEADFMIIGDVIWFFFWIVLAIGLTIMAFKTSHKWISVVTPIIFVILTLWLNSKTKTDWDIWYILRILSTAFIFVSAVLIFIVGVKKSVNGLVVNELDHFTELDNDVDDMNSEITHYKGRKKVATK